MDFQNNNNKCKVAHTKFISLVALAAVVLGTAPSAAAAILEDVKQRGVLRCGVNAGLVGFANANSLGQYSGLDVDLCQAVASAIFNDPEAVEYLPVTATTRFDALLAGEFDMLSRNTTWTLSRNAAFGDFVGVNFYDGQGFMVSKRSGIRSALELDNASICVSRGTTTELNAVDFFKVSNMRYRPVYFEDDAVLRTAYNDGKCVAMTTDRSGLAAQRTTLSEPDAHVVLPEVISKEPLGPMVPAGDSAWANVVRWSLNCMINAEEMGVTSANIAKAAKSSLPAVQRLLGVDGNSGELMGLSSSWCANIISNVGNYGESYERNVGPDTPIGLERGVNGLWTNGGLLYAPPIR
ncbi:MAG: amino acid ABC transporter substrate-binding protein [Granulosicoccaceae bacterium]